MPEIWSEQASPWDAAIVMKRDHRPVDMIWDLNLKMGLPLGNFDAAFMLRKLQLIGR